MELALWWLVYLAVRGVRHLRRTAALLPALLDLGPSHGAHAATAADTRAGWGAGYEYVPPPAERPRRAPHPPLWQPAPVAAVAGGPPWAAAEYPRDTALGAATGAGPVTPPGGEGGGPGSEPSGAPGPAPTAPHWEYDGQPIMLPRLGAGIRASYAADGTCLDAAHRDGPGEPWVTDWPPGAGDGTGTMRITDIAQAYDVADYMAAQDQDTAQFCAGLREWQ